MKLSDMALEEPEGEEDFAEGEDAPAFEEAATDAFELFKKGDKAGAAAALKGAIELCVADYMAEDPAED